MLKEDVRPTKELRLPEKSLNIQIAQRQEDQVRETK